MNEQTFAGKTVALTGSTGGLGGEICRYVLDFHGKLILLDRNPQKAEKLCITLKKEFPKADIERIPVDLKDIFSVEKAAEQLLEKPVDILFHNAGAYHIPREKCLSGYDNVFQINFLSPYYITKKLLPLLSGRKGKVVVMGSIAHEFVHVREEDPDAMNLRLPSMIYGNSKRHLMFSFFELIKENPDVSLSVVHPGITLTNITSNYPKWVLKMIRRPMKLIFLPPKKAALGAVKGMLEEVPYLHWIGPGILDIWGKPRVKLLRSCSEEERQSIFSTAERVYQEMKRIISESEKE